MSPDCTANCAVSWMAVTGKCRAINLCGKPTLSHGQGLTAMRSRRRKPRTSAEPTPVKMPWSARHQKTALSFKLVVRSIWSFEVRFNPTPHPNIQQIIPPKKTSRTTLKAQTPRFIFKPGFPEGLAIAHPPASEAHPQSAKHSLRGKKLGINSC